jgi:hypothetical protein
LIRDISPRIFLFADSSHKPFVRIRDMSRVHEVLYQNIIPAIEQFYKHDPTVNMQRRLCSYTIEKHISVQRKAEPLPVEEIPDAVHGDELRIIDLRNERWPLRL